MSGEKCTPSVWIVQVMVRTRQQQAVEEADLGKDVNAVQVIDAGLEPIEARAVSDGPAGVARR